MADTIYIGGDIATSAMKVLFSEQDFVDVVEEYMGRDARNYLHDVISRRNEAINAYQEQETRFENLWMDGYKAGYEDGCNNRCL